VDAPGENAQPGRPLGCVRERILAQAGGRRTRGQMQCAALRVFIAENVLEEIVVPFVRDHRFEKLKVIAYRTPRTLRADNAVRAVVLFERYTNTLPPIERHAQVSGEPW